jgi:hypothetical protein
LLALCAVCQGADMLTTCASLARGGREINPPMVWVMRHFGDLWWMPKLAVAAVALALLPRLAGRRRR